MTEPEATASLSHISVLVIEDEDFTRAVVVRLLAGMGCAAVHDAACGVTALALLKSKAVDAVICDVAMKPLSGLDLLRRLRASATESERRLPLIFLTARANPEDIAVADTLGRTTFLTKPPQPAVLGETLLRHCPKC